MRGTAIVLMVVFHLCFNLNHFGFIDINIYHGLFWHYFRFVIVTLFLLCVGISLHLANAQGIDVKKNARRFALLGAASLAITVSTYITFPKSWIYFGILHFIAVASVLGLLFVKFPRVSLLTGIAIIAGWNLGVLHMHWLFDIVNTIVTLPQPTEDLAPLTPWFGVVLLGIFAGHQGVFRFPLPSGRLVSAIAYLGKHALVIYLAHQPVLFGIAFLASLLRG